MKDWIPSTRIVARTAIALVVVGGIVCAWVPTPARAEALETLLPYVIENHDRVRAAKSRLTAARNRAREALGGWYPTLSQTANAGHETQENDGGDDTRTGFNEWDISLTQLLWDFGSTNAAIDKARLQVEEARYNLIETRQSLILEAITAYMNVIRSNAALKFAKDSEDNIRRQTGLEEALVGLGSGFSTDVLQVKSQLAGAQARRVQSEGGLINALNRFQAVYGRMPDNLEALETVPFPAGFLPQTLTQATDIALESNPTLKNAILAADIAVEDVRIARADNFAPKIEASGERKFKKNVGGTIGAEQETLAKVEMTFDFNLGFTAVNTLRASESDLSATTFTAADTRRNIEEQTRNAWQQLQTAKQTTSHLNNQANIEAAFLELARNERQLGRRTLLEVLSSETKLINAKSDAFSAETDMVIAAYGVLAATGQLEYDVIKLSKGVKPPHTSVPSSAPAAETPSSAPSPAPALPVTPDNGQQINGEIEPDVTVAGGRSITDLHALFLQIATPKVASLPDTTETYGRSQSGGLVAKPNHPPKPKSRYDSFADFDTQAGSFGVTEAEEVGGVEFASSDTTSHLPVDAQAALPADSDTAVAPSTDRAMLDDAPGSDPLEEVARLVDADPREETVPTKSGFSFSNLFSYIDNALNALPHAQNRQDQSETIQVANAHDSVTMDMPPAPIPAPDITIDAIEVPAPTADEVAEASDSRSSDDAVTRFLGDVFGFFERAQPIEAQASEIAATIDDAPSSATGENADTAPVAEVASLPEATGTSSEPIDTISENVSENAGTDFNLFEFFEAAHQRALENNSTGTSLSPDGGATSTSDDRIFSTSDGGTLSTSDGGTLSTSDTGFEKKPSLLSFLGSILGKDDILKDVHYQPGNDFVTVDRN